MTKIKNYELDSTINEDDKVIGTDGMPGANFGRTKNYSIASLVNYIDTQLDPVDGSGTLNTIPIWTPDGDTLGDSIITYDTGSTTITVGGSLLVSGTGNIQGNLTAASISLQGQLADAQGEYGTAGQLLSSTGTAVDWVDAPIPGIQGSGTLNTLPMWTPDGSTLGDSIVKKDTTVALPNEGIVVEGKINVHGLNDGISRFIVGDRVYNLLDAVFSAKIIDASNSGGTANQILTSTGTQVSWQDLTGLLPANNLLGAGTLNTIAMFTPDGSTVGDSVLTYYQGGGVDTISILGDLNSTRIITGDIFCNNISAGATGTVSMIGNVVIGDQNTDLLTVNSRTSFQDQITLLGSLLDTNSNSGTSGQVLTSTGSGGVAWANDTNTNTTYDLTGAVTAGTDYAITLTGSDATVDNVVLKAGNSITLTDEGSNVVSIAATGGAANTTYQLHDTQNVGSTLITLVGSDASETSYTFTAGLGVTFDQTVAHTTTINIATDNVTGTGTTNYVTKWSGSNTIQDSLIFDNGTNVGIGTVSPTTKLEVDGDATFTGGDIVLGDNSTIGRIIAAHDQLHLSVSDNTGTGNGFIKLGVTGEAMRIDSQNFIGMGTTSPVSKLDVAGDIAIDAQPFASFNAVTSEIEIGDILGVDIGLSLKGNLGAIQLKATETSLELGNITAGQTITSLSPTWFKSSIQDYTQSSGTANQILISTGSQVQWEDFSTLIPDNVTGTGTENQGVLWGAGGTILTDSLLKHGTGVNSVGLGLNNDTQGLESIAFTRSTAKADYSFSLGYESVTDGEFSVALGKGSYTAGSHSMAANYKSLALGMSSFAAGHTSATGGDGAVALGHNASAGNYGVAKLVSTLPNGQTQFDIQGIVGTVSAGLFMRYGEGLDVADPRFEVLTFTDNGNNTATITIPSPGIRPIQGELVVFEQQTPFRGDHQGGVALGNDSYSLGEGAISVGHNSVAEADKAVAIGDAAKSTGISSVAIGKNAIVSDTDTIALGGNSTKILMTALAASSSYSDDTAAAAGGVSIGELYRNGNIVQIRLT